MKELVRLCDLRVGERAVIYELKNEGGMRRRLCDLGLVEETLVECVGKSPAGDPSAYLIRGAVIAIRRSDGGKILVERACNPRQKRRDKEGLHGLDA